MKGGKAGRKRRGAKPAANAPPRGRPASKRSATASPNAPPKKGSRKKDFGAMPSVEAE